MAGRGLAFAIIMGFLLVSTADSTAADPSRNAPLNEPPSSVDEVTYTVPANYDSLVQWWQNLEVAYPGSLHVWSPNQQYGLGQVPSSTGHPPYDLYFVRLTNESLGFGKPEVFFMGSPHGDERAGGIAAYWFTDWLLRHALTSAWNTPYDDWLRWILDNREVYFAVSHNPDGFDWPRRCDAMNVDLNREADHDGPEGPGSCPRGASMVFDSVQGRTVARFLEEHQIRAGMDFHGGIRAILYPWGSTRSSVSGVSPITNRAWSYAPPDFYYFDVFGHRMGDFIGDFGGNYGEYNVGTPPGIVGYVAHGTYLSWAYGADSAANPAEAPFVANGPYRGAGALWITPEISAIKNPPQSQYGGDDTLGWGMDVRRMLLAMIDVAQPYVRWHPSGIADLATVQQGESFDVAWQVNGSLVADSTVLQWGADPDPVANPDTVLPEHVNFAGQWTGGTGWDGAMNGATAGYVWKERIRAPTATGTYYFVARAKVDQRYRDVLRPDVYGTDSYLRILKERATTGWSEDIAGADGIEHMESREWWTSPILRVEVVADTTAPVITLRSPPVGSVIRAGTPLDFDVYDGMLDAVTVAKDGGIPGPLNPPYDVGTFGDTDGVHAYDISARDLGGLVTDRSYSFLFDSTPPAITLVAPPDGSVIAAGTVIDLFVFDANLAAVYAATGGQPVILAPPHDVDSTGWIDGPATLEVTALDEAGNARIASFDFTVDAAAPSVVLDSPANGSVIPAGRTLYFGVTDTSAVTVTWNVGAGPLPLEAPHDLDTTGWPDGPIAMEVAATDAFGRTTTAAFSFTVDSTGPAVVLVSPQPDAIVLPGTILDFEVVDPHLASVTVRTPFGVSPLAPPYDVSTAGWPEGSAAAEVIATDLAGNERRLLATVSVDGTPPDVTRIDGSGPLVRPGSMIQVQVLEDHLDRVVWSMGGPEIPLPSPYAIDTAGWGDAEYTITVRAMDVVGNEGTLVVAVTIDGTGPAITASPQGDVVARPGLRIVFTVDDPHLAGVSLAVGNEAPVDPWAPPYAIDTTGWADGLYVVRVSATDEVFNSASAQLLVTIDGTPPDLGAPSAGVARVGVPTAVAIAADDAHGPIVATLLWRPAGRAYEVLPMVEEAPGVYSAAIPAQGQPGTVEFYIAAEDLLGNEAQTAAQTLDVLRPSVPPQGTGAPPWTIALGLALWAVAAVAVILFRLRRSSRAEAPSQRQPRGKVREEEHRNDRRGRE